MDILGCFENVLVQLKAAHQKDPNQETWENEIFPAEWLYIRRITDRMKIFSPEASSELIVAANCQHLCRWKIERTRYPEGRIGYYQWRNYLSDYQKGAWNLIPEHIKLVFEQRKNQ